MSQMMVWMSVELMALWMSSGRILAQILGKSQPIFVTPPTTNLTQHDSRKPDDHPNSIDYHHLDMSRDDGME
jgi:hypothetical protein